MTVTESVTQRVTKVQFQSPGENPVELELEDFDQGYLVLGNGAGDSVCLTVEELFAVTEYVRNLKEKANG